MALERIITDGTETGTSAALKINASFDLADSNHNGLGALSTTVDINTQNITDIHTKITSETANFSNLPTTDPAIVGELWNNAGVLNISNG